MIGWLVDWSVGQLVGWLVGWSVGRSVGRSAAAAAAFGGAAEFDVSKYHGFMTDFTIENEDLPAVTAAYYTIQAGLIAAKKGTTYFQILTRLHYCSIFPHICCLLRTHRFTNLNWTCISLC